MDLGLLIIPDCSQIKTGGSKTLSEDQILIDQFQMLPSFNIIVKSVPLNYLELIVIVFLKMRGRKSPPPLCLLIVKFHTNVQRKLLASWHSPPSEVSPSFTVVRPSSPSVDGGHCPVSRFPRSGLSRSRPAAPTLSRRVTSRGEGGFRAETR